MWMEMKFGRNKLSENQSVFKETLQQYGASYNWVVCYCWTDAVKTIAEYTGMEDELWTKH
jgi:uroporphyrinogen-III synthase